MWQIPKMWNGGECWIIGGGTSIHKQFGIPDEVVREKMDLRALSPYFEPIHSKHIIGLNAAFMLGDWVSLCYFGDRVFFDKHKEKLYEFPNLKIRHVNLSVYDRIWYKDIKQINFSLQPMGICTEPDKIYWNYNSGAAAINLAYHLGAKRVYLLGYDMKPACPAGRPDNDATHWHNAYGDFRIHPYAFQKFLKPWRAIAQDAARLGLEIINVNPDSAIEVFPKVNLNEVI